MPKYLPAASRLASKVANAADRQTVRRKCHFKNTHSSYNEHNSCPHHVSSRLPIQMCKNIMVAAVWSPDLWSTKVKPALYFESNPRPKTEEKKSPYQHPSCAWIAQKQEKETKGGREWGGEVGVGVVLPLLQVIISSKQAAPHRNKWN